MMKPESKPIAESKIPAPKASVYSQSSKLKPYFYIDLSCAYIVVIDNVYSNIYLDRYLPKKKYNNYYRRRKRDPRTEIKPIVYRQNSGDNHRLIFLIFY